MTENNEEFKKIIDDFTNDLINSFPELEEQFKIINYNEYYDFCKEKYPINFFNILYENETLFDDESNYELLPNINFKDILQDDKLSEKSKKTIWKYLQLILFCVCNNVNNKEAFGDTDKLFEAINENDLHKKIEETMNEMQNIFMNIDNSDNSTDFNDFFEKTIGKDISDVEHMFNEFSDISYEKMANDISSNMFENTMDPEKLKEHLSGIMDGKIGSLAKEIADEASKELGMDIENMDENKQQDFLKNMFKNPSKIMDIVKNIGGKLEEKFKSGDIKESELLEEAQEIMGKMNDIPGLKNMMSSMGLNPNGKFDFKGMANKMQQNMKQSKMKERMQEKLKKNNETKQQAQNLGNATEIKENTFVWNDDNSTSTPSVKKSSKKPSNKKKNKKKKKN